MTRRKTQVAGTQDVAPHEAPRGGAWTRRETLGLLGVALPLACRHPAEAMRTHDMERKDVKDVVVVGGGPGGLSAALMLGRARRKVLLCDAGPRRNAAATEVHYFLTRDGIPPQEFRDIAREQLKPYAVEVRDVRVRNIERVGAAFRVELEDGGVVEARRVLLATGMVDVPRELPGYRELWGNAIFQCPYCHGWEVQARPWGVLATSEMYLDFALVLRSWTEDLVVFTQGAFPVPEARRAQLARVGVRIEERRIRGLVTGAGAHGASLAAVELEDGTRVPREVLFDHPPQRQVPLVQKLGLELTEEGFVKAQPTGETSVPGIFAVGDMSQRMQAAIAAASAAAIAASMLNHSLSLELAGPVSEG